VQSTKCWVCIVQMSYKRTASSVFLKLVCSVHKLCTALILLHNVRAACEVCNPQYARCALCKVVQTAICIVFLNPVCFVHKLRTIPYSVCNACAAKVCNAQCARCACANVIQANCEQCFSGTSVLCAQAAHNTQFRVQCVCSQGVQCSVCSVCIV